MFAASEVQSSVTTGPPIQSQFDTEKLLVYRELYYDGFSSIIAARDLTTGAAVAVKKIDFDFPQSPHFSIRQLRKHTARKLRDKFAKYRQIAHASVLKLLEFVVEPTRIVIMSEMCMFGDLFNWMLQQQQLRIRDICLVIQYIFQALHYLHSQNLVHGNLNPTHVLFQALSPQSVTLMPDISVRAELFCLTSQVSTILDCLAPELIRTMIPIESSVELTPKLASQCHDLPRTAMMDVWSAAIIAHIALTGKPPFEATSLRDLLRLIDTTDAKLNNPILKTWPANISNKLREFLQTNPQQRALANEGADSVWFDDELLKKDDRNVLFLVEYDLINTCRKYRLHGRQTFESIFQRPSVA